MSTRPETRRILALVVVSPGAASAAASSPEDAVPAHLATLAEAALMIAPVAEVRGPDAVLLDASAARLFGGERTLAEAGIAIAERLGLQVRAGIADGLWAARVLARSGGGAADARGAEPDARGAEPDARDAEPEPRGSHGHPRMVAKMISRNLHESGRVRPTPARTAACICIAAPGDNAAALAHLPLSVLELPPYVLERLAALGLHDLGAIATLPTRSLAARFGALGEQAVRLARGLDPTPLTPHTPVVIPEESQDLEGGVEALEPLIFITKGLAERLAARLAGQVLGATALTLTLLQDSREAHAVPLVLTTPSASTALWMPVLKEAIGALRLPSPVIRVTLTATATAPAVIEQLAIDDHPERIVALEAVLSRLESRLGEGTVLVAQAADRHRPEGAFTLLRFDPAAKPARVGGASRKKRATRPSLRAEARVDASAEHATHDSVEDASAEPALAPIVVLPLPEARTPLAPADPEATTAHRPTRLCLRPEPIELVRAQERWVAARVAHELHAVEEIADRERLVGEWWLPDPFDRTYVRVRLRGLGECWVFRVHGEGRTYIHGYFD